MNDSLHPMQQKPETRMKALLRSLAGAWQRTFQRRRSGHDPMLVFNMSIFNLNDGWSRIFNPFKAHENGWN
jgi:hypothetical protein